MLANTFKSYDLNDTLDGVIHDRSLLGGWVECFGYLLLNCSVISVYYLYFDSLMHLGGLHFF
jgi:hypothetical protein